jgi:adenine phosphoribosyltransferase
MNFKEELEKEMSENSAHLIPMNVKLYRKIIPKLIEPFKKKKIDKIVSLEAKGFFYASIVAYKMKIPFSPIFKGGRKVPKELLYGQSFVDYCGDKKSLEIGKMQRKKGEKILLVDDVFETGESAKAAIKLIEKSGGKVVGVSIIYNKLEEKEEKYFNNYKFNYLVR